MFCHQVLTCFHAVIKYRSQMSSFKISIIFHVNAKLGPAVLYELVLGKLKSLKQPGICQVNGKHTLWFN